MDQIPLRFRNSRVSIGTHTRLLIIINDMNIYIYIFYQRSSINTVLVSKEGKANDEVRKSGTFAVTVCGYNSDKR